MGADLIKESEMLSIGQYTRQRQVWDGFITKALVLDQYGGSSLAHMAISHLGVWVGIPQADGDWSPYIFRWSDQLGIQAAIVDLKFDLNILEPADGEVEAALREARRELNRALRKCKQQDLEDIQESGDWSGIRCYCSDPPHPIGSHFSLQALTKQKVADNC